MVRNESERVTRPVARHDVLRWVRALGVGCLLTGLAVAAAPGDALAGASWRQPGYGRTNQSYNPDEATITADNVGDVPLRACGSSVWFWLRRQEVQRSGNLSALKGAACVAPRAR